MTQTRDFHLGDVLSITSGRLVSPRHIEGVYDILGFMTGEQLWTHQLPKASRECAPILLAQHPQLADVTGDEMDGGDAKAWEGWLRVQVGRFGETLPVAPLPPREAQFDTPIADAIEMMGDPTKVLVVEP